jgi:hypothetical protein
MTAPMGDRLVNEDEIEIEITPGQLHAGAHEGARVAHQLDRHSGLGPDIG